MLITAKIAMAITINIAIAKISADGRMIAEITISRNEKEIMIKPFLMENFVFFLAKRFSFTSCKYPLYGTVRLSRSIA